MAYEPSEWLKGLVLNGKSIKRDAENGMDTGGVLIVDSIYDENTNISTLTATFKEIILAMISGKQVLVREMYLDYTETEPDSGEVDPESIFVEVYFYPVNYAGYNYPLSPSDDSFCVSCEKGDYKSPTEDDYPSFQ